MPLPETRRELLELQKEAKYYLIEELVRTIEAQLVSQTQVEPICTVPLITSQKEEQALVGSTGKVSQILVFVMIICHLIITPLLHFTDIRLEKQVTAGKFCIAYFQHLLTV